MKLNKSPGLDELKVKFYQTFWDKIIIFLLEALHKGYEKKVFHFQIAQVLCLYFFLI